MKNDATSIRKSSFFAGSVATVLRPSVVVGVLYVVLIAVVAITQHYTVIDFVHIGTVWANHDPSGTWGYDGQFYYQMATDPLHAYLYMDNPAFREQHVFYPVVVGILSLGQKALVPYMLLFVNIVALVVSVEVVARLLVKYGFSPWFSLAIGLYFGQTAGLLFDTAEPFTYGLVCVGIWLVMEKERFGPAALLMGLASLSREIAVIFPIGYACVYFLAKKWRVCAQFILLGILPLLAWLLCLRLIYGQSGVTFTQPFEHVPFAGIFDHADAPKKFPLLLLLMFLPTLAGWVLVIVEFFRNILRQEGPFLQRFSPVYLVLVANLVMITFLNHHSFDELISCGRIATGLVLSVLLYGMSTRNKYVLIGAQFYTLTFLVYVVGTFLHLPSFIA